MPSAAPHDDAVGQVVSAAAALATTALHTAAATATGQRILSFVNDVFSGPAEPPSGPAGGSGGAASHPRAHGALHPRSGSWQPPRAAAPPQPAQHQTHPHVVGRGVPHICLLAASDDHIMAVLAAVNAGRLCRMSERPIVNAFSVWEFFAGGADAGEDGHAATIGATGSPAQPSPDSVPLPARRSEQPSFCVTALRVGAPAAMDALFMRSSAYADSLDAVAVVVDATCAYDVLDTGQYAHAGEVLAAALRLRALRPSLASSPLVVLAAGQEQEEGNAAAATAATQRARQLQPHVPAAANFLTMPPLTPRHVSYLLRAEFAKTRRQVPPWLVVGASLAGGRRGWGVPGALRWLVSHVQARRGSGDHAAGAPATQDLLGLGIDGTGDGNGDTDAHVDAAAPARGGIGAGLSPRRRALLAAPFGELHTALAPPSAPASGAAADGASEVQAVQDLLGIATP
jgi:hypothetical protein